MTIQRIQIRRDTSAGWAAENPVLASGEFGLNTTTGDLRIGNGVSAWSALASIGGSPFDPAPLEASIAAVEAWLSTTAIGSSPMAGGITIGQWYDNSIGPNTSTTKAMASDRIELAPMVVGKPFRFDAAGIAVSTAAVGAARVVIYGEDANGWPGSLLHSVEIASTNSVALQSAVTDYTLLPALRYWVGVHTEGAPTLRCLPSTSSPSLGLITNSGTSYGRLVRTSGAFASGAPASISYAHSMLIAADANSIRFKAAAL